MNTAEINKDFDFGDWVIKTPCLFYFRSVKVDYVKETNMLAALVKIVVASQHKIQRNKSLSRFVDNLKHPGCTRIPRLTVSLLRRCSLWEFFKYYWVWEGVRGTMGRGKGIPRALLFFPLPRPTAKKPLRSKQYERGLCGGEKIMALVADQCRLKLLLLRWISASCSLQTWLIWYSRHMLGKNWKSILVIQLFRTVTTHRVR